MSSSFQTFLNLNWHKIIKSGFVFQIQPYDCKYKPFVIHIFPSSNGKASQEIIDKLFKIKNLAKNRIIIIIKTFAFDGDNAYKNLHLNYFKSYATFLVNSNNFFNLKTKVMHVVSDFFHLLKRLRYRLLSSILHAGFTLNGEAILIDEFKTILNEMGDVVFCNEKFTKMNVKLAIELFKPYNFIKLLEFKKFAAAAYWFPISTSIIAILTDDFYIWQDENLRFAEALSFCYHHQLRHL